MRRETKRERRGSRFSFSSPHAGESIDSEGKRERGQILFCACARKREALERESASLHRMNEIDGGEENSKTQFLRARESEEAGGENISPSRACACKETRKSLCAAENFLCMRKRNKEGRRKERRRGFPPPPYTRMREEKRKKKTLVRATEMVSIMRERGGG